MSWTVWKAELQDVGAQIIKVPKGARILSVGKTDSRSCRAAVWFSCDPLQPLIDREILVCVTGGDAPSPFAAHFIGTVVFDRPSGPFVLHVFERF